MATATKGVFCIEAGDWWGDLRKDSSVKPLLSVLSQGGTAGIRHIHRTAATREEFEHYLGLWAQKRYSKYPILYLAAHGRERMLDVGGDGLSLEDLGALLESRCHRRVIFFGACEVLKGTKRDFDRFLRQTGALAVMGYTEEVEWLIGSAFEMIVFSELQENAFRRDGLAAVKRRLLPFSRSFGKHYGGLGFRMDVHPG